MVLDLIMEGDEAKRVMRGFEVSRMAPRNRAEEEEEDDGEQGGSSALRFLVEVVEVEDPWPRSVVVAGLSTCRSPSL